MLLWDKEYYNQQKSFNILNRRYNNSFCKNFRFFVSQILDVYIRSILWIYVIW